jgi:MYXO-CTERM domain-containing protein
MVRARILLSGAALFLVLGPAWLAYAQVTCYVDSVAGDNTMSGLSEAEAVQSRDKIPSTCTIVKFKRGSVFDVPKGEQAVPAMSSYNSKVKTITNYGDTSLPLPKFIKKREANNGGMISAYSGGVTIDGIYMEGAESDAQMQNLGQGICIMMGSNSKIINNEITNCDIGIMLSGTGTLVQNNYIHDLHVTVDAAPGVDPNVVGGAEGIFVNGSNNEVAYNSFINCSDYAEWTGGSCDGGATEVTVGRDGAELTGVKIHHNYSYNSCGFFEVSSMFSSDSANPVRGKFTNSEFYNNVTVDSGWLHLLQVANTDMHNIRWTNNTLVQHKGSLNAGILMVVYTAVASGMSGGQLYDDSIYWTNNYFVADGVNFQNPDSRVIQTSNIIIKDASKQDPGFVNLQGTNATDYDLVQTSPAVNAGTVVPAYTIDFLNRTTPDPTSGQTDVGAFEYDSTPGTTPPPTTGGSTGSTGAGGVVGSGGTTAAGSGGTTAAGSGGAGGTTSAPPGSGGTTAAAGGRSGSGGASGSGGTTSAPPPGSGGSSQTTSPPGSGGDVAASGGAAGNGGTPPGPTVTEAAGSSGCNCRLGQAEGGAGLWVGLIGFALLVRRRRQARR